MPVCSNCGKELYDRKYCQHCGQLVSIYNRNHTGYRFMKVLAVLSVFTAIFWFIPLFFQILYLSNFHMSGPLIDLLTGIFLIFFNSIIYIFSFFSYRFVSTEKIRLVVFIAWSLFFMGNVPFLIYSIITG